MFDPRRRSVLCAFVRLGIALVCYVLHKMAMSKDVRVLFISTARVVDSLCEQLG